MCMQVHKALVHKFRQLFSQTVFNIVYSLGTKGLLFLTLMDLSQLSLAAIINSVTYVKLTGASLRSEPTRDQDHDITEQKKLTHSHLKKKSCGEDHMRLREKVRLDKE